MIFLCDTNIISELARPQPNPGVLEWSTEISSIVLSVITIEEITYGLTSKPNVRIQNWFNQFLNTYCQIMPITDEIAQRCGELRGQLRTQGKPRSQADMLIAATAQVHQLTLVTRNIRDFEDCGILILNPFT
ncbi:MAG: type II toxin-antitoxin system VapC family toxin [Coleofasciculus chthonoplastes F3-SA18-01]|uniref:PIN domain-containing protein n=1 Tax=Coleofasciculus chthonoplastes TaxID=64178 RepID=UPI0033026316